jgi:hypothetical protein
MGVPITFPILTRLADVDKLWQAQISGVGKQPSFAEASEGILHSPPCGGRRRMVEAGGIVYPDEPVRARKETPR